MDRGAERAVGRILLIGMMGSGKTTVGRALARRLGWPYHDNDAELRAHGPASARQLLAATDEAALLEAEIGALDRLLARPSPCIVAAAGATILDPGARGRMRAAGFVVWLRVTAVTILARVGDGDDRPWRAGDRQAWVQRAVADRAELYGSIADLVVDADTTEPERVVDQILDAPS